MGNPCCKECGRVLETEPADDWERLALENGAERHEDGWCRAGDSWGTIYDTAEEWCRAGDLDIRELRALYAKTN